MPRSSGRAPLADRFWSQVEKSDGCWLWSGSRDALGYPRRIRGGPSVANKKKSVSSVAWYLTHGAWPKKFMLHACDNPPCVRVGPGHIFEGTQAENVADMVAKRRHARGPSLSASQCGEVHSDLTSGDILAMRAERVAGATYQSIATRHGLSLTQAYRICRGQRWAHIQENTSGRTYGASRD